MCNKEYKHTMDNEITSIDQVLRESFEQNGNPDFYHFRRIVKYWEVIMVGLADKTAPIKLKNKVLYITVSDSAYTHNLSYYVDELLQLIASEPICGEGAVRKIIFRTGELPPKSSVPPEIEKNEKQPPAEQKEIIILPEVIEESSHIQDEELRNIFSRYMNKTITRKREKNAAT